MGDAGALFLGILISSLTVRLDPDSESKLTSFAIPLMLLAVPILDTTVAVFSRVRRGMSIFRGGQDHLSHRLLRTGLTKRQTAYTLWSLAGVFAFIATTISIREQNSNFVVYLASIVWLLLLLAFLKSSDE
jgi:UDP-GlcNAc:undecaprenyl-phosphate GlcNAc-1-phosphate transferase